MIKRLLDGVNTVAEGMFKEGKSLNALVVIDLYQLFRDPHSSFDLASRQYSFMTIGPVSPLSFAGTPLFLNVFNTVQAFMKENKLWADA